MRDIKPSDIEFTPVALTMKEILYHITGPSPTVYEFHSRILSGFNPEGQVQFMAALLATWASADRSFGQGAHDRLDAVLGYAQMLVPPWTGPEEPQPPSGFVRTCRQCGCSENRKPCITDHGPCFWIAPDLCSACAPKVRGI